MSEAVPYEKWANTRFDLSEARLEIDKLKQELTECRNVIFTYGLENQKLRESLKQAVQLYSFGDNRIDKEAWLSKANQLLGDKGE